MSLFFVHRWPRIQIVWRRRGCGRGRFGEAILSGGQQSTTNHCLEEEGSDANPWKWSLSSAFRSEGWGLWDVRLHCHSVWLWRNLTGCSTHQERSLLILLTVCVGVYVCGCVWVCVMKVQQVGNIGKMLLLLWTCVMRLAECFVSMVIMKKNYCNYEEE